MTKGRIISISDLYALQDLSENEFLRPAARFERGPDIKVHDQNESNLGKEEPVDQYDDAEQEEDARPADEGG